MKRGFVVTGLGLVLLAAAAGSASAQTVGADLALNSAYFWRGLSLSNKPVIQPDLYLTFGHKVTFTAGGWGNIELGKYDDPNNDLSEGAGTGAFNLTEFDWWGEFNLPAGIVTLTAGATGYIYPNDKDAVATAIANGAYYGLTSDNNTTEIYGKVALGVPLSPKFAIWYDVDKIKGAYMELSAGLPIHLTPVLPLQLGVLAGFSAGQGCEPDSAGVCQATDSWNFHDDGLTHVDVSASLPISAGAISITPNVHGIITSDDATKVSKPTESNAGFKFMVGVTLSWSKSLGASEKTE